nr:cell cycle protein [Flavisolibacter sp.]
DVQLTMDAGLQTGLQKKLAVNDSMQDNRVSIVVMEDFSGDVLASAMWPLPPVNDWEKMTLTVREQNKLSYWLTINDLGFTYATQPGSTAKVATTLAAFNKLGEAAARKTIAIRPHDLIRVKGYEPDEAGNISMERALVRSNNSYFIKLANEEKLQEEMATIYLQSGMFLRGVGGYYYERNLNNESRENEWREFWRRTEFKSLSGYNRNDIRKTRGRGVSGMAWGQGELIATPAAVARLVSGITNNGLLLQNKYVLKISDSLLGVNDGIAVAKQPQYAFTITDYMKKQSANKVHRTKIAVGGKTGTPERIIRGQRINDGWYVFFAPKARGQGHIVACIRIEGTKGSSDAVQLAGDLVIPELIQRGYIKGFGNETLKDSTTLGNL